MEVGLYLYVIGFTVRSPYILNKFSYRLAAKHMQLIHGETGGHWNNAILALVF